MPHGDFHPVLFVILAVWVLVCAVGVVAFRNIVHSAMAMVLCFLGVAGVFVLLDAGLLAIIQILVYVGAISVVVLFAIMLTETRVSGGSGWVGMSVQINSSTLAAAYAVRYEILRFGGRKLSSVQIRSTSFQILTGSPFEILYFLPNVFAGDSAHSKSASTTFSM